MQNIANQSLAKMIEFNQRSVKAGKNMVKLGNLVTYWTERKKAFKIWSLKSLNLWAQ